MATSDKHKSGKSPKPEISALGMEVGVDTNLAFTTPFRPAEVGSKKSVDEELNEVIRDETENAGPTVRQLMTMRRMDGQATALYRLLTLPMRSALKTCTFVPAEGGEKEAEFVEQVLTMPPGKGGMTVTFHRFMSQLLLALFDGFAAFEKVFWVPPTGPLEGKIVYQKIAHRPSDTISFITDKRGGFAGLRQRAHTNGQTIDAYIEPDYAFYYAAQEELNKFYGVSFFQSAFYHYDKKVKLYYTAHLAAQRSAVGTRIGTVPPNASLGAKREFQTALGNLALAQWMMVPEGFKVEILREGGNYNFLDIINHHNHMMSQSLLAGFMDSDTGGGANESGSLVNFAQPGDDMFLLMLRTIQDEIANQINHYIIPQLIDWNFESGNYPTFTWGKITDEQKAAISATFDKLANERTVTPEFMRKLEESVAEEFGLEVDYEEVEEREAGEAEMAAQGLSPDGAPLGGAPGMPGAPGAPGGSPAGAPGGAGGSGGAASATPVEPGMVPPEEQGPEMVLDPDEAPPTGDPESWQDLEDFETAIGYPTDPDAPEEEPETDPDQDWASLSDFEATLGYRSDDEEISLTDGVDLIALAQTMLDLAIHEEEMSYGA